MKQLLCICVIMLALLSTLPASAALYDNFDAAVLNPVLWFGAESSAAGVDVLESGRQIKVAPILIPFRGFNMSSRSYASVASDTGNSNSSNRLMFRDGSTITGIRARVLVKKVFASACGSNAFATEPRVRIGGMFFNTGIAVPGDDTNDIFAFIAAGRPIDSANAANILDVYGQVRQCTNADCTTSLLIGEVVVGTMRVFQKVTLRITWDSLTSSFIFQKGRALPVSFVYTGTVGGAPGSANGGSKRLEIQHMIANCTTARPMTYMEAFFDDVEINP